MITKRTTDYEPDYSIHPGEILNETLQARGIRKTDFAERCGISLKTISQIVNCKAPVTPETALQFERVLDVSADNCGYDVLCKRNDGILRVEVKGMKTMLYPQLSRNEYLAAEFYKDSFVLFVVKITNEGYEKYEIYDPINNIDFTEILRPIYIAKGFEKFAI